MNNKEIIGVGMEVLGLVTILLSIVWQINFSGWWYQEEKEWKFDIQHEVNLTLLKSLENIVKIEFEDNVETKIKMSKEVISRLQDTYNNSIIEKSKRDSVLSEGQAAKFGRIENYLVFISALLLVFGKWFTYSGMKKRKKE